MAKLFLVEGTGIYRLAKIMADSRARDSSGKPTGKHDRGLATDSPTLVVAPLLY
ncbi:hypothetical protein [Pseudotamlana haliotis]|uniref:hypothetical protein n=1 Tax=Pseudotamlana haliotis TaxID=2614804 RepID=UPI00177DF3A0|nr:hypothetical protein [Tamlana haliotis]